jgi:hypothetical protein
MRLRLALLAFGVCLVLQAQATLTVKQLVGFVRSAIELKQPDKQVAAYLSKVKLSEKLDGHTMEELQGLGAGPRTVEALNSLRLASQKLPAPPAEPPPPAPYVQPPPPSQEEQKKVLDQVRDYALNYTKSLPDFLCTQVTRRYIDPSGMEFWGQQDVITARVAYVDHKEDYKLMLVNNHMVSGDNVSIHSVGGATSSGEFGSMMSQIFLPKTEAVFGWERWATLRKRGAYVFNYRVTQTRSEWHVTYESKANRNDIVPAYHGLIFVDRDTLSVMRITQISELPASFPIQQADTTLDYDLAGISGREYMLPIKSVTRMREGKFLTKNDLEFRLYRKFTAEAEVKFDTPEPLPEEKTKEEPAK